MKKILAVAAFAFAFSVNGYAQEAAAPAESPAPAAQKCCKNINKNPCRNLPARVFSAGRGQPHPFR